MPQWPQQVCSPRVAAQIWSLSVKFSLMSSSSALNTRTSIYSSHWSHFCRNWDSVGQWPPRNKHNSPEYSWQRGCRFYMCLSINFQMKSVEFVGFYLKSWIYHFGFFHKNVSIIVSLTALQRIDCQEMSCFGIVSAPSVDIILNLAYHLRCTWCCLDRWAALCYRRNIDNRYPTDMTFEESPTKYSQNFFLGHSFYFARSISTTFVAVLVSHI